MISLAFCPHAHGPGNMQLKVMPLKCMTENTKIVANFHAWIVRFWPYFFTAKRHWWPTFQQWNNIGAWEESPRKIKQPAVYSVRVRDSDENSLFIVHLMRPSSQFLLWNIPTVNIWVWAVRPPSTCVLLRTAAGKSIVIVPPHECVTCQHCHTHTPAPPTH